MPTERARDRMEEKRFREREGVLLKQQNVKYEGNGYQILQYTKFVRYKSIHDI